MWSSSSGGLWKLKEVIVSLSRSVVTPHKCKLVHEMAKIKSVTNVTLYSFIAVSNWDIYSSLFLGYIYSSLFIGMDIHPTKPVS